ncbi:maleylacetoacetate isomerase [Fulvimonas soli]|jgi:maleylacetoacetate isomerase/maleylpyruvate isomerase|uniref:Maleylacetoacetate isomerase n=1 Tax=Fulvimonas soli TaxID=155197 RepID=A0A316I5K0_9GAMM|nr:maleylacetoacetate isomerase [Fulvimonas soli]PWK85737.1 maleylacetoacetate isomerase [Fulvimonas soli]TNY25684.1 maleylacetoacetate isomerase [Fulvimonas soli]
MTQGLVLYGYWRSSAAYRVRIALNLKGLPYESRAVHLLRDGGEQHAAAYRALNPQELVPCLLDGGRAFTQSMAIIEYLDEAYPDGPRLLPAAARDRARVRALAQAVACDVHPLGNLRVLQALETRFGAGEAQRGEWMRHWIGAGFAALEAMLAGSPATGRHCHGDTPGLADACLVPQVYNALRWKLDLAPYPTVARIHAACNELEAFRAAAPEAQPDAPGSGK